MRPRKRFNQYWGRNICVDAMSHLLGSTFRTPHDVHRYIVWVAERGWIFEADRDHEQKEGKDNELRLEPQTGRPLASSSRPPIAPSEVLHPPYCSLIFFFFIRNQNRQVIIMKSLNGLDIVSAEPWNQHGDCLSYCCWSRSEQAQG